MMPSQIRLIYLTNDPAVGAVAERAGVDWIFVDMEYRGKHTRQISRDTVISAHTLDDVRIMRDVISISKLMVRINPMGEWSDKEISDVLDAKADIIMLPFFKKPNEVSDFLRKINGRAQTCLLLETLEAIDALDEILAIPGIDFVHIGLNDIHIARGTTFMFEFLADGGVDRVAKKLRDAGIIFGFGGIARIGSLLPPAERILAEHFRVGSTGVILSRSFFEPSQVVCGVDFESMFKKEVMKIREHEQVLVKADLSFFENNRVKVIDDINRVVSKIKDKQQCP